MISLNVSSKDAENSGSFANQEPVPEGVYQVTCIKVEDKTTKDGTGKYLSCQFQIEDGDYQGRKLFTNLNYANKNPKAAKIATDNIQAWVLQAKLAKDGEVFELDPAMLQGTSVKVFVKVAEKPEYTDHATGKVYPAKKDNDLTILAPSKAGETTQPKKPVDKSEAW